MAGIQDDTGHSKARFILVNVIESDNWHITLRRVDISLPGMEKKLSKLGFVTPK
jgi:hypothetical protein